MRYIVTINGKKLDIETSFSHDGEVHELIRDGRSIKWNLKSIAPQIPDIETRDLIEIIDKLLADEEKYTIDRLGTVRLDIQGKSIMDIIISIPIYQIDEAEDDFGIMQEYTPTIVRKRVRRGLPSVYN